MTAQIYYEDVEVGAELPVLVKTPTTQQLAMYAGASGDFYQIHYDKDYAIQKDLPGVIVHGMLGTAFVAQAVTDWMGEAGLLKKFGVQYRGMMFPNEDITVRGKVIKKHVEGGERLVECEVWAENSRGERTTPGRAVVALPSRKR